MSALSEKKELEILCRYVPRVVLAHYAHTRAPLVEPVSSTFPAIMALFDISGFSSLADRLTKEENIRPAVAAPAPSEETPTKKKLIDTSRHASHRRISHASAGRQESLATVLSENERNRVPTSFSQKEKRPSVGSGSGPSDFGVMRSGMAVEQLTKTLNQTLAPVIDIITQYNGDIIKFAGDAMIVMWETASWRIDGLAVDHGTLLFNAISCALQVLNMLESQENLEGSDVAPLKMHVGMGFSVVTGNHVGGLLNRWEFYVGGPATSQMSFAEADATAGELVISRECFEALNTSSVMHWIHLDAHALDSGNYIVTNIKADREIKYALPTLRLGRDMTPFVKSYVPGSISLSLGKGKLVNNCMRSITAVFIKFAGILDITDPSAQVQEVHKCLCAVQDAAYRVHATIRQFLIDDKGAVAIAIVGLPPFYHENNALHGIRMALYLQEKGIFASIGITSGLAFCGSIGSSLRAEYAVVGDIINLSARLMSMALPGQILCDEATHTATQSRFEFDKGTPMHVKGKGDSILAFRVYQDIAGNSQSDLPVSPANIFISSDVHEFVITRVKAFGTRAPKATSSDVVQTILLRGASGAGKTKLLRHLANVHPNVYYSSGDAFEKTTRLYVWRRVISYMVFKTHSRSLQNQEASAETNISKHQSANIGAFILPATGPRHSFQTSVLSSKTFSTSATRLSHSQGLGLARMSISESPTCSQLDDTSEDDSVADAASNDDLRAHFGEGLQFVHSLVKSGVIPSESLPLLNVFIPHCFPETSHSLEIARHEERFMEEVMNLVLAIVRKVNETHPILIAFDDSQFIDAASWELLLHVLSVSQSITCAISVRPDAPPTHFDFKKLETQPHCMRWELRNMSHRDTSLFLSQMYGIAIMNSYVLEYVHARAHGNPGNTIALMTRLLELDTISIDVERGVVHVLKDIHEVDLEISQQTRAKVMSHFDQLTTTSQLAMRIVSVAIDTIHFDALHYLLRSVYAIEYNTSFTRSVSSDTSNLPSSFSDNPAMSILAQAMAGLETCQDHGIVEIDSVSETVRFMSDDMRLVVYNVMLPSQRETIHRVFALWFENEVPIHRIPRFQHCFHLGYHLSRTRMYNQSMHYFAKGAEEALLRGVSEHALKCLTSAGNVLLLMDTTPRGLRKASSTNRSFHESEGVEHEEASMLEMTLHQCKIEFLTGLVMVQKSEWSTAVENFNAAIAIHQSLDKKTDNYRRYQDRFQRWWRRHQGKLPWRRPRNRVTPANRDTGIQIDPSLDTLVDEVEGFIGVAKRLRTKILIMEREREQTCNVIRLQGLGCISKSKEAEGNLEKTFVLVPDKNGKVQRHRRQQFSKQRGNGSRNSSTKLRASLVQEEEDTTSGFVRTQSLTKVVLPPEFTT